jgi:hypothetical protein
MSRKRPKKMTREEFEPIADMRWVPVALSGEGQPSWMRGIPDENVHLVLASGTFIDPRIIQAQGVTISDVVGGLDIYRFDQDDVDKGYPINKDHYLIVMDPTTQDSLLVLGPYKDHEHWLSQLPDLSRDITIIEG